MRKSHRLLVSLLSFLLVVNTMNPFAYAYSSTPISVNEGLEQVEEGVITTDFSVGADDSEECYAAGQCVIPHDAEVLVNNAPYENINDNGFAVEALVFKLSICQRIFIEDDSIRALRNKKK